MKKNPHQVLMEIAKESYDREMESLQFFFEHSDKLITWLIGFAVGGITLIVANFKSLINTVPNNIRVLIILLSLTIIFGLLYRLLAFFYLSKNKSLENYFSGFFGEVDMTPVVADDISASTIKDILEKIESDFGLTPAEFNPHGQELILQSLKDYYLSLVENSKKHFEIGINSLAETYEMTYKTKKLATISLFKIAFGLEEGKGIKMGFNAKSWKRSISFFFSASVISFLISVITICISFFIYIK